MSLLWIVYLIGLIQPVTAISGIMLFVLGLAAAVGLIILLAEDDRHGLHGKVKVYVIHQKALLLFLALFLLVPSKETAYTMLAAYGLETIVANEHVQELGGKSLEVINKAMDEYLGGSDASQTNN